MITLRNAELLYHFGIRPEFPKAAPDICASEAESRCLQKGIFYHAACICILDTVFGEVCGRDEEHRLRSVQRVRFFAGLFRKKHAGFPDLIHERRIRDDGQMCCLMIAHGQRRRLGGLNDLLNSAEYIERVVQADRSLWEEYKANVEYISLCKQQLDLQKEILDEAKANAELEEANQETLIAQKNNEIYSYQLQINATQADIAAYQAQIEEREAEIEAALKAIEDERRRLASQNGLHYDGGQFLFPLASYKYVSSDFGYRNAPTAGASTYHRGIDFAANFGTDIYAAYDGEVAAAAYSGAMGNYVMIDHGGGLYTVYEHCSSLYVNKGDRVVMGQTIAAVGSTGISTGNHLHFGVRLNGEYTSPWPYLGK